MQLTVDLNTNRYIPKTPAVRNLDLVYDVNFSDVQPFLFKLSHFGPGEEFSLPSVKKVMKSVFKSTFL